MVTNHHHVNKTPLITHVESHPNRIASYRYTAFPTKEEIEKQPDKYKAHGHTVFQYAQEASLLYILPNPSSLEHE
jgi:hypothetical protein